MNTQPYPIAIRDVSPHPEAIRLTGINPDGLPGGIHTGGAWLYNGEVYKPLDARPNPDAKFHYETSELAMLEDLRGLPLFPFNWRLDTINGRKFVIRPNSYLIPEDWPYDQLDRDDCLYVESAIRSANQQGWEIGDEIALAKDPTTYELFIYDLSCAMYRVGTTWASQADDFDRIMRFFERCGMKRLQAERWAGRRALSDVRIRDKQRHVKFAYGSYNRPISRMWARKLPDDAVLVDQTPDRDKGIPHTWVFTSEVLPDDVIRSYELCWYWSAVH